jgi:hypothetical protein
MICRSRAHQGCGCHVGSFSQVFLKCVAWMLLAEGIRFAGGGKTTIIIAETS